MLRGAIEAMHAIARLAAWEGRVARGSPAGRGARRGRRSRRRTSRGARTRRSTRWRGRRTGMAARRALGAREPGAAARGRPPGDGLAVGRRGRTARTGSWRRGADLGGGAVALKLDAEGLAHKSEAGGVALGLGDEPAIRAAAARSRIALGRAATVPAPRSEAARGAHGRRPASSSSWAAAATRCSGRRCSWGWAGSSPRCWTMSR